jgi:hypothetical protein
MAVRYAPFAAASFPSLLAAFMADLSSAAVAAPCPPDEPWPAAESPGEAGAAVEIAIVAATAATANNRRIVNALRPDPACAIGTGPVGV